MQVVSHHKFSPSFVGDPPCAVCGQVDLGSVVVAREAALHVSFIPKEFSRETATQVNFKVRDCKFVMEAREYAKVQQEKGSVADSVCPWLVVLSVGCSYMYSTICHGVSCHPSASFACSLSSRRPNHIGSSSQALWFLLFSFSINSTSRRDQEPGHIPPHCAYAFVSSTLFFFV